MGKEKILAVDDEEDILELVRINLSNAGYHVICATSGEMALDILGTDCPDLILLDLMFPGMDGFEVAKRIRKNPFARSVPIIMMTARGEEKDIVDGLEAGADDYICKPFSPRVLVARIKAVLRRKMDPYQSKMPALHIHGVAIHPGRHEVYVQNNPVNLTFTEFEVLSFLARRPGWVFSRSEIVKGVRGKEHPVTDRSVDVQILGLRKKLGPAGKYIETVRGVGYRFRDN